MHPDLRVGLQQFNSPYGSVHVASSLRLDQFLAIRSNSRVRTMLDSRQIADVFERSRLPGFGPTAPAHAAARSVDALCIAAWACISQCERVEARATNLFRLICEREALVPTTGDRDGFSHALMHTTEADVESPCFVVVPFTEDAGATGWTWSTGKVYPLTIALIGITSPVRRLDWNCVLSSVARLITSRTGFLDSEATALQHLHRELCGGLVHREEWPA